MFFCVHLPSYGIGTVHMCHLACPYRVAKASNSYSYTCTTGTLSTESFPQPNLSLCLKSRDQYSTCFFKLSELVLHKSSLERNQEKFHTLRLVWKSEFSIVSFCCCKARLLRPTTQGQVINTKRSPLAT